MDALVAELVPTVQSRVARALTRRRQQARGRDLRQELEDMVQEVFASLFAHKGRALRSWDAARGLSLRAYIGFLAEREVARIMRVGKRNPWKEDPTLDETLIFLTGSDGRGVESRLESRDFLRRLADRLRERLSPRGRQYFELMYVENRPIQEVAEATGSSAQALYAWRNRLVKLLQELRSELEAEVLTYVQ